MSNRGVLRITLIMSTVAACLMSGIVAYSWLESDGSYDFFFNANHPNAIKSMRLGDEIIVAIEDFKKKEGTFPGTLEQLQPLPLKHVPEPVYGTKKWSYRMKSNSDAGPEFVLSFHGKDGYPVVFYESKVGRWSVDN